jgi:AbrB family looped-hinge helix DNA binding protein
VIVAVTDCAGKPLVGASVRAPDRPPRRPQFRIAEMRRCGQSEVMPVASPPRTLVQVSPRGQLTLPAEVRSAVGVRAGDTLVVTVEQGRIVLQRAVVLPVEAYDDERMEEFREAADLTAAQVAEVRRKWGI